MPFPLSDPLDSMHMNTLNYCGLLVNSWRGAIEGSVADAKTFPFAVLVDTPDDKPFTEHGLEVERARPFLPGFFDRAPRNLAQKWNSGFKAIEMENYLYVYAPQMMQKRLPKPYWEHLCKSVRAVRNMSQYEITQECLVATRVLLNEVTELFEDLYYGRNPNCLHYVRPVVHNLWHLPDQVALHGSLIVRTQIPMERQIGDLGGSVKQPSKPYANLSQCAARRFKANIIKTLLPSLDRAQRRAMGLPRGAEPVGDGYIFLRALEPCRSKATPAEARAFYNYFARMHPAAVEGHSLFSYTFSLRRWARVRLPNGHVVRSAWKEHSKALHCLRMARCVKVRTHIDLTRMSGLKVIIGLV